MLFEYFGRVTINHDHNIVFADPMKPANVDNYTIPI